MRVVVYPHDLNMGGSQINAIELAAAVRNLGHECVIFGQAGTLGARISELGLEFIQSPRPSHRPTPSIVSALSELVRARGIDVIHGYEWPPGWEAYLAAARCPGTGAVCTVMSMAVAPFLPRTMPLVVGTQQIAAYERSRGRNRVHVLEPPVDLHHNEAPDGQQLERFRATWKLDDRPLVVCVSRLASELKAEGILTAIDVAADLARTSPFQLLLVGDGPAREAIAVAAARTNEVAGPETVIMTGELVDPRPAYAAADISLAMGGSALRSMAFGKPLIVQGENGFFRTLTPESVDTFSWQGWYGSGHNVSDGARALREALQPLLTSVETRDTLGQFAREIVQNYSLDWSAKKQVEIYERAIAPQADSDLERICDGLGSAVALAGYAVGQQLGRLTTRARTDDFNAKPVVGQTEVHSRRYVSDPQGPIVYLPGVDWDAVSGTDRRLTEALSRRREVIWMDPPRSILQRRRTGTSIPPVSNPIPRVTRLSVEAPPGNSRPGIRAFARTLLRRRLRRYLTARSIRPSAIIASSTEPLLKTVSGTPGIRIYFATDDFVAGAPLWKRSSAYLSRARESNLSLADIVLAVTPELASVVRRRIRPAIWYPNGADIERYAHIDRIPPATDVSLPRPIAGVIGQFNERIDIRYLEAVQKSGQSLLLIGPRHFTDPIEAENFEALVHLPGVQWIDRVPSERVGAYLRTLSVGLTPYADSDFNRRSFPLKTVEYLAAGLPVVTSAVAPIAGLDARFVSKCASPDDFASRIREVIGSVTAREDIQRSVTGHSWSVRAEELLAIIDTFEGPVGSSKGYSC